MRESVTYKVPARALARFERMRLIESRRFHGGAVIQLGTHLHLDGWEIDTVLPSAAWRALALRLRRCARWVRRQLGDYSDRRRSPGKCAPATTAVLCERFAIECEMRMIKSLGYEHSHARELARHRRRGDVPRHVVCDACGHRERFTGREWQCGACGALNLCLRAVPS